MNDFFVLLLDVSVVVFPVASMLSVGLAYSLGEIVEPLRDLGAVGRALAANFVLVPALAWALGRVLSLDPSHQIGLALLGLAAGAPFLIKLTAVADGDVGLGTTLLVLLLPATVVVMPLAVPLIVPEADVSAATTAGPLLTTMLLPLAIGLVVRRLWGTLAERSQPFFGKLSTVSLVVLIAMTVIVNSRAMSEIWGQGVILAAVLFILGAFGIGFGLGGSDADARSVLGLGTGQRNIAAATVVAVQSVGDADALVMLVVAGVVGQVLLFPIAALIRRADRSRPAPGQV